MNYYTNLYVCICIIRHVQYGYWILHMFCIKYKRINIIKDSIKYINSKRVVRNYFFNFGIKIVWQRNDIW